MSSHTVVHEGTVWPDQEKTYLHLPFEAPTDTARLEVEYSYSDRIGSDPLLTGGNTIDLGVFDSRGIDFLAAGFRGWSGSERASFFITENDATPGYLAGPLTAGRWHVLLGLYKIAPHGCSYRVSITVTTQPERQPVQAPAGIAELPSSPPPASFAPWLRGELHCHTWHSDGDMSATDLVKLARERGLDFLAIADHNTIASQRELEQVRDPGLVLIRGVEVTTFKGHFNVWGIPDWVDFRVRRPEDMQAALQFANERGAVTSCGHPKPYGPPWEYPTVSNHHCVEVWNGPWTEFNQVSLDYWRKLLATGRCIPALGGSDYHRLSQMSQQPPRALGTPTVWAHVTGTPSAASILQAIRLGHISLSEEPTGPFLDLRAGPGYAAMCGDVLVRSANVRLPIQVRCQRSAGCQLRLLDQQGVLYAQDIASMDATLTTELALHASLYVRAELRTAGEQLRAMTNPVYLQ